MNKQSLYLFGGALLASTALTTASQAATFRQTGAGGDVATLTALSAKSLGIQVFAGTAAGATADNAVVIGRNAAAAGGTGTVSTAANGVIVSFTFPVSLTSYRVDLDITSANASFAIPSPTAVVYVGSATGLTAQVSGTTCTPAILTATKVAVTCTNTGGTSIDGVGIFGLSFSSAAGLAVASSSITLSGSFKDNNNDVVDTITSANFVTSADAATSSVTAATTGLTIDNTSTTAFTQMKVVSGTNSTLSAVLGSIQFSMTGAFNADLSQALVASQMSSTVEVKITHGVLTDNAFSSVVFSSQTRIATHVVTGAVTFQVGLSSLGGQAITVNFNGTSVIDATSGTATAAATLTAGVLRGSEASFSGSLGQLTAGGLSSQANSIFPTSMGSEYQSFIRVANTSTVEGAITFTVYNDNTGASLGSFSSSALTDAISAGRLGTGGVVKGGSTFQLSAADIEANVSTAAATGTQYRVVVTGPFNGYIQAVLWNSVQGIFTDLSGFRNGATGTAP